MNTLLGLETPIEFPTFSPSPAQCLTLLDRQRIYAEKVVENLFARSITSAVAASMSHYDLMVQSWVLRMGHYQLAIDHAAFRALLNGVIGSLRVLHAQIPNVARMYFPDVVRLTAYLPAAPALWCNKLRATNALMRHVCLAQGSIAAAIALSQTAARRIYRLPAWTVAATADSI